MPPPSKDYNIYGKTWRGIGTFSINMQNSKIEWCDHTNNLWWGCEEVHRGCDNCYARVLANRWGKDVWGGELPRERKVNAFKDLATFQRKADLEGVKKTVFVGSMMDVFEKSKPLLNPIDDYASTSDLRIKLFTEFEFNEYPNLIFLFLTKRPSNINKMITEFIKYPLDNIWFGASVVDHKSMMDVSRHMDKVNGNTFWSIEPLLEKINIKEPFSMGIKMPQWIIVGGESGRKKRPFSLEWADQIQSDCAELGIPYFFKQIDKVKSIPEEMLIREFPKEFEKNGM